MSDKGAAGSAKDHESPFAKRGFLISAGIIVVIAVLAVVYLLLPSAGQPAAVQPTQPEASNVPSSSSSVDDGASVCGLAAGDQRLPGLELTSKWEILGRAAVPTEPQSVGPGKVDGSVRTCFAHNPTGALYAAANFFGTSTVSEGGKIMVENLSAPNPTRDKYIASPPPFSTGDSEVSVQIAGFQVHSFTQEAAAIVLGIKNSNGGLGALTIPLKWVAGDWKVDLASFGRLAPIDSLADFIPWSGV